jgi:hypothetical protein
MSRTPKAKVLQKQAKAVALLQRGYSYDQIAEQLGYTNRGAAWRLVQNALRQQVVANVEQLRTQEVERLDRIQHSAWESALMGDRGSALAVLDSIRQRARLLGLEEYARQAARASIVIGHV